MTIKYVANAVKWFDKVNGNTYHSVRITRCEDNATIAEQFQYGYGDAYRHTAIMAMAKAGWIDAKYTKEPYMFERENEYPVYWAVSEGLKRDCIANGKVQP